MAFIDVVMVGDFPNRVRFGQPDCHWMSCRLRGHVDFNKNIGKILEKRRLDWLSYVEDILSNGWHHGTIDRARLVKWKSQFRHAGSNEWIGDLLLKRLDFWGDQRLVDSCNLSEDTLKNFDCIAVNRKKPGKSADAVANLLAKRLHALAPKRDFVFDLHEVLIDPEMRARMQRILYIEDGLFSGTEVVSYLRALLGDPPPDGRPPKFAVVPPEEDFRKTQIQMHFPVATSLGYGRLRGMIKERHLSNLSVSHAPGGFIEVFTEEGKKAMANGSFYHPTIRNCTRDSRSHICCHAFTNLDYWRDAGKQSDLVTRAIAVCRELGEGLFRNYLDSVTYKWPPEKISECALGMHGLGLALAFSHSIPKAALPLFWAKGEVTFQGKKINWMPLFENAC